jgi:hypothetical protein
MKRLPVANIMRLVKKLMSMANADYKEVWSPDRGQHLLKA